MTVYYSLFVRHEDGRCVELTEKTLRGAKMLEKELVGEGLSVEILERYDGPMETDPNYNDFVTPAWKQY